MSTHKSKGKLKLTQEEVLARFKNKHGDDYDYSLFVFCGYNSKSKIICREHGVFYQSPAHHFRGQGCPSCKNGKISKKLKKDNGYFINKANKVHDSFYNYSMVDYDGAESVVSIICPNHGVFNQIASVHLAGHGCKGCANDSVSASMTKDINHFLLKANIVHKNTYDYSESKYTGVKEKIKIKCRDHGYFYQDISNHLAGKGCPDCGVVGFSRSRYNEMCNKKHDGHSNLYVIKCFNEIESFYKIGITAYDSLKRRFTDSKSMPYEYEILFMIKQNSDYIWQVEKKLHHLCREKSYRPKIIFAGHTECFSEITKPVHKLLRELSATDQLQLIA